MKRILLSALACAMLSGCMLLPKPVELFQKRVKALPELSDKGQEYQRQAADYIARNEDTNRLAGSLSSSLGPPYHPWTGTSDKLADRLDHQQANLNEDLRDYRDRVEPLAGKKIEGTGLIRIPYFAFIGLVVGGFMLLWAGVKAYGVVNPVVGTAAGVIGRVSSSVLHTGFSELVAGGSQFLNWVQNSSLTADAKAWVINTFKVAHQTQQSPATQAVVDKLTTTQLNSTVPPTNPPAA